MYFRVPRSVVIKGSASYCAHVSHSDVRRDPHTLVGDESFAQRTRYKIHSNFYLLTSGPIRRITMLSAVSALTRDPETVLWRVVCDRR